MRRIRLKGWHLFPLMVASLIPALGCGRDGQGGRTEVTEDPSRRLSGVRVYEVRPSVFVKRITVIGVARPDTTVTVSAEESGMVVELLVDKGDKVKEGQVILRLDDSTLRATLAELDAAYRMARLDHEKLRTLKRRGGAVPDFDLANAALREKMAAAKVDVIRARLKNTVVVSPAGGVVERKMVERGEYVTRGTPLVRITDISTIRVEAGITERDMAFFRKGAEARLLFDAYPEKTFNGKIDYISTDVDTTTGTFKAEISVSNGDGLLRPGMLARVSILKERCPDCLLIPRDAVIARDPGRAVFVVDAGGTVRLKSVVLGEGRDDLVVVGKGLEPGDKVVVEGQWGLVEGEKVRIVE